MTDQNNLSEFPTLLHLNKPSFSNPNVVKPNLSIILIDLPNESTGKNVAPVIDQYVNIVKAKNSILPSTLSIEPIPIKKIFYNN